MIALRIIVLGLGAYILAQTAEALMERMLLTDHAGGYSWFFAMFVGIIMVGMAFLPEKRT